MITIAATQVNAGGLWEAIRAFFTDFNKMFPGFEGSLENARAPFYIFGFVILVYSLVKKLSGPGMSTSSNMRAITGIVALVGAMAFCIQITNLTQVAFLDLATQMAPDADPVKIEESMEELLVTFTKGEVEKQQVAAAGGQAPTGIKDSVKGFVSGVAAIASNPGAAISAGLDSALASMMAFIEYAMIYILVLLCKLAEMLMWLMILLQKFLILINSIFLPVMIAMLGVSALSGVSTRYILSMFGVCAWPLAWGVVNAGTVAMMISVNNTLEGATDLNSMMSRLWAMAMGCVIPFWLVAGYTAGPFILQKMVTTGAGVAQGLMGKTATMIGTAVAGAGAATTAAGGSGGGSSRSGSGDSTGVSGGRSGGGSSRSVGGESPSGEGGSGSGSTSGAQASALARSHAGASLAGTFATGAGNALSVAGNSIGSLGNALAATEGHGGSYRGASASGSSSAANDNSPEVTDNSSNAGQRGGNDTGAGAGGGSGAESATTAKIPQKMSNAELDAYAAKRGMEMAAPKQSTNPSDLYPGLTESSAEAWHQEQIRAGLT